MFFSVLCLLCICMRLFICALWSPAGKGLTSWLSFVMSNCEFVTFPLVSWVRCGTWLYRFLIFAPLLTLNAGMNIYNDKPCRNVSVKTLKLILAFPCSLAPISKIMLQLPDALHQWDFIDNVQRTDMKTFFLELTLSLLEAIFVVCW